MKFRLIFRVIMFFFFAALVQKSYSQGFRGFYDPANWVEDDPYNRATMISPEFYAPDTIVWSATKKNPISFLFRDTISLSVVIANCATSFSFDWSSSNVEYSGDAYFSYSINDVTTLLTNLDGSGTIAAIPVNPGDVFKIFCVQLGCGCGNLEYEFPPTLTISNFNVSINDAENLSGPLPDSTSLPDLVFCTGAYSYPPAIPTATDFCAGTVRGTPDFAGPFIGQDGETTTITWTYDDGYGQTSTQTQNIIFGDITPPELNYCAPDITVNSSDEFCGAKVNRTVIYDIPLAQLSGPNFTSTDACYPGFPQVYFNDSIGISWSDLGSEAPTSVYIEYIEGYNEAGLELNATFNGVQNGVYNSGSDIDYIGTCYPVVSYQTLSIENYNVGGINSVTIDLPGSAILGFVESPALFQGYARVYVIYQGQMDLGSPYFTDNCDGTITTNNAPQLFPIGTTVVTWTATDSGGNTTTCQQEVTVVDVAPKPDVVSLPDVIGECSVNSLSPPTATDNCAGAITGTTTTIFPITTQGATLVTWSFDDGSGNVSTQTQNVILDDVTAPVPDIATLPDVLGACSVNSIEAPTATDNCGALITGMTTASFPISTQGTHIVTWTFDDGNGNVSTQTQNVVLDDVNAPVPDIATLPDVLGECSINSIEAPTATDNCGALITGMTAASFPISSQGTHIVTWTFDDGKGNVSAQTQNVILDDVTPPLPDLATLPDVLGECSINSIESPTATDNCGAVITGSTTSLFPITSEGIHLVTWTFDDGNGNVSTQTQNVVLDDVTAPSTPTVLTVIEECSVTLVAPVASDNCSGNIVGATTTPFPITEQGIHTVIWVFDDGNGNSSSVNQQVIINDFTEPETPVLENVTANCEVILSPPTTTDNCTGLITGATTTVFPVTAPGTTIVMWTFDDGNGNYVLVYQNINITPLEASVSVSGFTLTAQNTNPDVSYQWIDCANSGAPIVGENGVSFTAIESGNYALQVTQNGCTETSECYEISMLGITQALQDKCHVYPNPASSEIFIESKANGTYILQDMNGKMVLEDKFNSGKNKVDLDTIQTGMYILTIYKETSFERIKLSVERQ